MPWLQRAEAVRILWGEEYHRRGPRAPELQIHLAMHGVPADLKMFKPIDNIVGAGLLAAAKEFNCDLLVMGAYAHSRLRQQILGGVTRHILEHATLPVMMHREPHSPGLFTRHRTAEKSSGPTLGQCEHLVRFGVVLEVIATVAGFAQSGIVTCASPASAGGNCGFIASSVSAMARAMTRLRYHFLLAGTMYQGA